MITYNSIFFSAIRRKLLTCFYKDDLKNERSLEDKNAATDLQKKILQFHEQYLFGIVHSSEEIVLHDIVPGPARYKLVNVHSITV